MNIAATGFLGARLQILSTGPSPSEGMVENSGLVIMIPRVRIRSLMVLPTAYALSSELAVRLPVQEGDRYWRSTVEIGRTNVKCPTMPPVSQDNTNAVG